MPRPDQLDIRIVADDLTGALDSAVCFYEPGRSIDVTWRIEKPPGPRAAVDLATREGDEADAAARHAALAAWLRHGALRFKKVDSLLRGHVAAELEACLAGMAYDHVIVAPAFPFQGRVTRGGRQWRLRPDRPVGPDLRAVLASRFAVSLARPGDHPPGGIAIYDAESEADLDAIVAGAASLQAPVLWVGTGGLASALARALGVRDMVRPRLRPPFLALVGTNHDMTVAQVRHFATAHPEGDLVIGDDISHTRERLARRLSQGLPCVLRLEAEGERSEVARRIDAAFSAVLEGATPPGTLLVTGGETLRAVCERIGVARLEIDGLLEPGLPLSRIRGGRFDGVATISKSGAFGGADLLLRLCRHAESNI